MSSSENKMGCTTVIGIMVLCTIADLLIQTYRAWALSWLWAWYITGVFVEYNLTFAQTFGALFFIGLLRANFSQIAKDVPEEGDELFKRVFNTYFISVLGITLSFGIGFVCRQLFYAN